MRRVCIPALLLVAYSCAAQSPFTIGQGRAPMLAGNLLGIADGQLRLESTVIICIVGDPNRLRMDAATTLTSQIFAAIRVKLEWHRSSVCPGGAGDLVFLRLVTGTLDVDFPGALGMALPLEGHHAWVFYDRIQRAAPESRQMTALLAHVMAHEIAHVLQGVIRHSESGILKAKWSETDCARMVFFPLLFTREDAMLIRHGLEERRFRLVSKGPMELSGNHSGEMSLSGEKSPLP